MKKLIFATMLSCASFAAFAHGYYEVRTAACDEVSMRRALDSAAARSGAVITVVKCDAAPAPKPAPRVRRMEYVPCCDACWY